MLKKVVIYIRRLQIDLKNLNIDLRVQWAWHPIFEKHKLRLWTAEKKCMPNLEISSSFISRRQINLNRLGYCSKNIYIHMYLYIMGSPTAPSACNIYLYKASIPFFYHF